MSFLLALIIFAPQHRPPRTPDPAGHVDPNYYVIPDLWVSNQQPGWEDMRLI